MVARLRGLLVLAYCGASMAFFFALSLPVMLLTRSGDFPIWLARFAWSLPWLTPALDWVSRST